MPVTQPRYVEPYLEELAGPNEQHAPEGGWTYDQMYDASGVDPNAQEFEPTFKPDPENPKGYSLNPGGITHAGLTLKQMGDIGEAVVLRLGELPGIGAITPASEEYNHPIDAIVQGQQGSFGCEIKTNHSQAQQRFKVGGKDERLQKIDYCNPPEAPIWMADLSFKPLGEIQVGDRVMGWTWAGTRPGRYGDHGRNHLCAATVLSVERRQSPIIKVVMASGRTLRCTPDHWWLHRRQRGRKEDFQAGKDWFVHPEVGRELVHVIDPTPVVPREWERDASWLGGIWDGEGSTGDKLPITIYQSESHNPRICREIERILLMFGFDWGRGEDRDGHSGSYWLRSEDQGLRQLATNFANWFNPINRHKLVEKVQAHGHWKTGDRIVAIEPDGEGEVISMATTTGNYVAWGYASKNCYQNGLKPALIGVRLNFYTNLAYVFFREGLTDTWVGNERMIHVGTFNFEDLNPFRSTDPQAQSMAVENAHLPDQSEDEFEGVFGKVSANQVMYHVAPRSARESILQHGLDHSRVPTEKTLWGGPASQFKDMIGTDAYPSGNYLFVYPGSAEPYQDYYQGPHWGGADMWKVNTEGLNLIGDPQFPWDDDDPDWGAIPEEEDPEEVPSYLSYYTTDPIGPERLQLVDQKAAKLSFDPSQPRDESGKFTVEHDVSELKVKDQKGKHTHYVRRCKHCGHLNAFPVEEGKGRKACSTCGQDPDRDLRLAKVVLSRTPDEIAKELGFDFFGRTARGHNKYTMTDPNGVRHTVVTGGPHSSTREDVDANLARQRMTRCLNGQCNHITSMALPEETPQDDNFVLRAGQTVTVDGQQKFISEIDGGLALIFDVTTGNEDIVPVNELQATGSINPCRDLPGWELSDAREASWDAPRDDARTDLTGFLS